MDVSLLLGGVRRCGVFYPFDSPGWQWPTPPSQSAHPKERSAPTQLYHEIGKSSSSLIDLAVVRRCVSDKGANILYSEEENCPTLHRCIMHGHVEALQLLLETPHDVDFTVMETVTTYPWSPLHRVACNRSSAVAMLIAILHRLSSHPNDRVDWSQKNGHGSDFLSVAAVTGTLSAVYPLVRDLPYYWNAVKPLVLTRHPNDADWAKLSEEDMKDLCRPQRGRNQDGVSEVTELQCGDGGEVELLVRC